MMPLIAAGAAAGVIPIVVHLLHRQKTTPIEWGAMQFLFDSPLKQKRREHIDHWLLMLCRMALLILLAIMLARPLLLESKYNPFATNTATDIAVVVDHSLSMSRRSGDQTLFEQAIGQVKTIAGMMRRNDSLSVVLAEHTPRRLNARPASGGSDIAALLDTLHQQDNPHAGLTDASVPEAVRSANNVISHGGNIRKLIFVITDEQRSGWLVGNQTAWRNALGDRKGGADNGVEVYAFPVNTKMTSPNVSVSGMNITPPFLGVGRPVQISATVSCAGPGDMPGFPISLIVDGHAVGSEQVGALAAGQSQTIRFDYAFTEAGAHWAKIQANVVDALEADNSCITAVNVAPKLPVLIIDGQLTSTGSYQSSAFLEAAMQPVDPAQGASTLIDSTTGSGNQGPI